MRLKGLSDEGVKRVAGTLRKTADLAPKDFMTDIVVSDDGWGYYLIYEKADDSLYVFRDDRDAEEDKTFSLEVVWDGVELEGTLEDWDAFNAIDWETKKGLADALEKELKDVEEGEQTRKEYLRRGW